MPVEIPPEKLIEKPSRSVPMIILGIGAVLWLAFAFVPILVWSTGIVSKEDWSTLGQIGDQFGAANALFSSLAMLAAIYAVIQGQHMLRIQQREYELTRDELKRSADAQTQNAKEQKRLIDSQIMLSLMDELNSEEMRKAIQGLFEYHSGPLSFESYLRRVEESRDPEPSYSRRLNTFFDRVYRLHRNRVVDDDLILAAVHRGAMAAFLRVSVKIGLVKGSNWVVDAEQLIRRLMERQDAPRPG